MSEMQGYRNIDLLLSLTDLLSCGRDREIETLRVRERRRTQRLASVVYGSFLCLCPQSLSCVQLSVTLRTVAHQTPLSMGLARQEYWSGLSCSSLGDLPDTGTKPLSPVSLALQADSLPAEPDSEYMSYIC